LSLFDEDANLNYINLQKNKKIQSEGLISGILKKHTSIKSVVSHITEEDEE
jgi:hypothetical protein